MSLPLRTLLAVLVAPVSQLASQTIPLQPAERRAEALVAARPATLAPVTEIAPGFKVTLWAAEPQLANPVALSFDERGRLYVAETYRYRTSALDVQDYPELLARDRATTTVEDHERVMREMFGDQLTELGHETERIRRLEDTDGNSSADRSDLVAEGFDQPLTGVVGGLLAEKNQLWLTVSPSLWRLRLNADEKSVPERNEVLRGFGVHIGSPEQGARSVVRGPDGMLYVAVGDRGLQIARETGEAISLADSGGVLRYDPGSGAVEVIATGLGNPQDLAFDDFGTLFVIDDQAGDSDRARLVQMVEGSDGGWRTGYDHFTEGELSPWVSGELWKPKSRQQPAYILPPLANLQDGVRGLAYQHALVDGDRGTFWLAHRSSRSASSGITAFTLQPQGAGFSVASTRPVVRGVLPSDLTFGPDSRLYFSDAGSLWPWPKSGRGRIYVVDATESDPATQAARTETRQLIETGMAGRTVAELANLLGHADQRVRLAAQFELADRGPESLPLLQQVAANPQAPRLTRVHALWGAGQLAGRVPGALNHVQALLRDADAEVRAQAARVLGDGGRFEAFPAMVVTLKDLEPRVAFFAAQSLGKFKRPDAIPALLELLARNQDRDLYLRQAVVIALARLGPDPALAQSIHDTSRAVRLGGLLAYRRLGDVAVAEFLQDFDAAIVREAALAIHDSPIDAALPRLAAVLEQAPLDDRALVLRCLNAHFRLGQPENATALGKFASLPYVPAVFRAEALNRLADWANLPTRDRVTGAYRPLPSRDVEPARQAVRDFLTQMSGKAPEDVQVATIRAVAALRVPGTGHALWDVVYQSAHPVRARVAALQALEQVLDLRLEVAVQHAAQSQEPLLVEAALPILARLPAPVALPILKKLAVRGTPADQKAVYPIIAQVSDPRADDLLGQALQRLRVGEVPLAAQTELMEAVSARGNPAQLQTLQAIEADWQAGGDRLAPYRPALERGDAMKGRTLFERHPRLGCIECHGHGVKTFDTNPGLQETSAQWTREDLLDSILHPNRAQNPGNQRTSLKIKPASVVTGIVVQENRDFLQLRSPDGTERNIEQGRLISRLTQQCEMPKGVGDLLSRAELRDLLSYLVELSSPSSDRGE